MLAETFIWHYIAALGLFVALGAIGHVCRAILAPPPDRLLDSAAMDRGIGGADGWSDWLFGGDYDDGGCYRLKSFRNLRNATLVCGLSGLAVMLLSPGAASVLAHVIDTGVSGLGQLFLRQVETASLI